MRMILRGAAFVSGGVLIAFGGLLFVETRSLGFPDGYISDVDRVLIPYDYVLAIWAIFLGISALGVAVRKANGKLVAIWWAALCLGIVGFAGRFPYEAYLSTFLATSAGG